jgi:alkyl hydroperoxide reductase subunit AhpC
MADVKTQNVIRIGDRAPDFEADSSEGKIRFHNFIEGKWAVLFSHPRDFTPVCASELGRVAQLKEEWVKRNVVTCGLSVDTCENHAQWIKDINEISDTKVDFPMIADPDRKISHLWGMLDATHLSETGMPFTVRSVFIIGADKLVKLILSYPASTGRNFNEILRVIDSMQLTVSHKVATPVDWKAGDDCVVLPSIPTEEARKIFPAGVTEVRKWLRTTPDPRKASSL